MLPSTPPISNMAEIEQRCSTLRFLSTTVAAGHGEFITNTFFSKAQMCVSSSFQVLEDATFLVTAATIRLEPVSAATLDEQPHGYPEPKKIFGAKPKQRSQTDHGHLRDSALGVLQRTHTAEELDKVVVVGVAVRDQGTASQVQAGQNWGSRKVPEPRVGAPVSRTAALSWNRWKAAEPGKTAFVGFSREKTHYAFVPCVTYEHAVNETTSARTFPGLTNVRVVVVCPSTPGASCSLSTCMNGCTVWRVPTESE